MHISVPKKSSYYYDRGRKEDPVLLCWIPRQVLEDLVENKGVSREILMDYPDGLDLEVSDGEFRRFERRYALRMPFDALEILMNFEGFQRSGKVRTWESIDAESLERVIRETRLREDVEKLRRKLEPKGPPMIRETAPEIERPYSPSVAQVRQEFSRSWVMQRKFDNRLEDIKAFIENHIPKEAPPEERVFGKPEMTEGESPVEFFFRFQQRSREGG